MTSLTHAAATTRLRIAPLTAPAMPASSVRFRPAAPVFASGATLAALALVMTASPFLYPLQAQDAPAAARRWTFLDAQLLQQAGSPSISRDGSRMLYTLSTMDWSAARRSTDVWVVDTREGVASARQLTFTADKSETAPQWAPDGASFVFTSNREATGNGGSSQLYWMRLDGGEARRLTDAKDGVASVQFSPEGGWLAWSAGKADEQQVWGVRTDSTGVATPRALTKHATPIGWWRFSRDGRSLFFVAVDTLDTANAKRLELKFDVRVRNQDTPLTHLWVVDLATGVEKRLTGGTEYAVTAVTLSDDGRWAGFRGLPNDRYARTITESTNFGDLYLLNLQSGEIERLTNNRNIAEGIQRPVVVQRAQGAGFGDVLIGERVLAELVPFQCFKLVDCPVAGKNTLVQKVKSVGDARVVSLKLMSVGAHPFAFAPVVAALGQGYFIGADFLQRKITAVVPQASEGRIHIGHDSAVARFRLKKRGVCWRLVQVFFQVGATCV